MQWLNVLRMQTCEEKVLYVMQRYDAEQISKEQLSGEVM